MEDKDFMDVGDLRKALESLPDDMLIVHDGMVVKHLQQVWVDFGYHGNKKFFMLSTGSDSIIYYQK